MLYLFYTKKEYQMAFLKFSWRVIRAILIIVAVVTGYTLAGVLWPLTILLIALFPCHFLALYSVTGSIKVW
jgi:hypothetical protein